LLQSSSHAPRLLAQQLPAGEPQEQQPAPPAVAAVAAYSPDFIRRRLLVFVGIVVG
jgi:hypothetical protein